MTQMVLMGALPNWATNWLTPIWLLGVGALLGLAILLVIWLVANLLSRVPAVGGLAENEGLRNIVAAVSAVVFFGVLCAFILPTLSSGQDSGMTPGLVFSLLIPLSIILGCAVVWLPSRRTVLEVPDAIREGALWPIFILTVSLATFGLLGIFISITPRETSPRTVLESLPRIPYVGKVTTEYTIDPTTVEILDSDSRDPEQQLIPVSFRSSELRRLEMEADQNLTIDIQERGSVDTDPIFKVSPDEPYFRSFVVTKTSIFEDFRSPWRGQPEVTALWVRNYGVSPATLTLTLDTAPPHPEVGVVLVMAAAVVGIFLLYILQRAVMPRLSAVALSTLKSEINQPLFMIIMIIGLVSLTFFIWVPYHTFGEDIKVLKDSGMVLIKVLCIIQAVWAASTSVSEEIEGRTALTVLSKPLRRRSFVIGKYLGIFWTVAVIFICLGAYLMLVTAFKPIYDAIESSESEPLWQICHLEMVGVVPGLTLAFLEAALLAAVSVAISTRLPLLANFVICFAVYVMGHLTPLLVQSSVEGELFAPVVFFAQLLSTVFPVLDHFSIEAAIAGGQQVPYDYLGWSLVYCLIYGMIALLLALVLFEDRDLA